MSDDRSDIAGYPLVRRVRSNADRQVWIASDPQGSGVELHYGVGPGVSTLARETEAIAAANHPHLLPTIDVGTDPGAVVVRPLIPRTLADWLIERAKPEVGEVVTALAPVGAALAALHAAGAAAGGFSLQSIRVTADGAPMLLAEGAEIETSTPTRAWREESERVALDVASWRDAAEALLAASDAALPPDIERALARFDLGEASESLLGAWPALPLIFQPALPLAATRPRERVRRRRHVSRLSAAWARVARVLDRSTSLSGAKAAAGIAAQLRSIRPKFWIAAGAGAVALGLAGGVTAAANGGEPPSPASVTPGSTPSPPTLASVPSASASAPENSPSADKAEPESTATSEPGAFASPKAPSENSTQDGAAAVKALLLEREECLTASDAACLATLHDPASPLLEVETPWRFPDDGSVRPVEQYGEAWLYDIASDTEPASVLVLNTEAGPILRDAWSRD